MIRRPPRSTRTDTRFPYTTLFRSDGVVVGEARREFLLVVGVTETEGEIELVGDVEDIVREQRPILAVLAIDVVDAAKVAEPRSEEHTSELQSLMRISYAVFCLKKKNKIYLKLRHHQHIYTTTID